MRASFEARVGFVGRRFFLTTSARRTRSARRASAASRFCCWLRRALETIRSHPSPSRREASRSTTRARAPSSSAMLRPGVPEQLDPRARGVDVLAPGAAGARRPVLELPPRDPDARASPPACLPCSSRNSSAGPVVQRTELWQNARIDPPDRSLALCETRRETPQPPVGRRTRLPARPGAPGALGLCGAPVARHGDLPRRGPRLAGSGHRCAGRSSSPRWPSRPPSAATGLSVVYSGFYRRPLRNAFYYIQAVFDLLLVTAVVHVTATNGTPSQFAALYILVIATSSLLLPVGGGLLVAALGNVMYVADAVWSIGSPFTIAVWLQLARVRRRGARQRLPERARSRS